MGLNFFGDFGFNGWGLAFFAVYYSFYAVCDVLFSYEVYVFGVEFVFFVVCWGVRGLGLFVSRFRITCAWVLHFWVAFLDCDLTKFCSYFLFFGLVLLCIFVF